MLGKLRVQATAGLLYVSCIGQVGDIYTVSSCKGTQELQKEGKKRDSGLQMEGADDR